MNKNKVDLSILLVAILSLLWALFATVFTLSGSVESNAIESGEVSYWLSALKLMFGTDIMGIYVFSWLGLLLFGFFLFRRFRG